jgi:hypothetical protein
LIAKTSVDADERLLDHRHATKLAPICSVSSTTSVVFVALAPTILAKR